MRPKTSLATFGVGISGTVLAILCSLAAVYSLFGTFEAFRFPKSALVLLVAAVLIWTISTNRGPGRLVGVSGSA